MQPKSSAVKVFDGDKRARQLKIVKKVILYVVLAVVAVYMILPFYCSLLIAFRPQDQITEAPIKLYPNSFTTENFKLFFEYNIFRYIGNTLITIVAIMFFQLLFCSMGGYALAKLRVPCRKGLIKFFYASMMLPGIISLIPQFIVVQTFGLLDSLWAIIVPAMYSIYGCLFMRSFFLSTPSEIAEAARIDGAGEFRIFVQLFLPMVMPGIITLALFTFNGNWNSYLWPSLVISDPDMWVMGIAIKEFEGSYNTDNQAAVLAGALITILPSILIFMIGQKYFMDNLTFAGIK